MRRQKILKFAGENLIEFFLRLQRGVRLEVSGLPEDSRFVAGQWNQDTATMDILVESELFEDLPTYAQAPEVIVTFKQVDDGEVAPPKLGDPGLHLEVDATPLPLYSFPKTTEY